MLVTGNIGDQKYWWQVELICHAMTNLLSCLCDKLVTGQTRSRTKMSEKFFEILDFLNVRKCQKNEPVPENGYENVRKFIRRHHTKISLKFQSYENLEYSSESACTQRLFSVIVVPIRLTCQLRHHVEWLRLPKLMIFFNICAGVLVPKSVYPQQLWF